MISYVKWIGYIVAYYALARLILEARAAPGGLKAVPIVAAALVGWFLLLLLTSTVPT